jgi:hypothetical protein
MTTKVSTEKSMQAMLDVSLEEVVRDGACANTFAIFTDDVLSARVSVCWDNPDDKAMVLGSVALLTRALAGDAVVLAVDTHLSSPLFGSDLEREPNLLPSEDPRALDAVFACALRQGEVVDQTVVAYGRDDAGVISVKAEATQRIAEEMAAPGLGDPSEIAAALLDVLRQGLEPPSRLVSIKDVAAIALTLATFDAKVVYAEDILEALISFIVRGERSTKVDVLVK